MRTFPIIPTPIMLVISIILIIVILRSSKKITHIIIVILLLLLNERFIIPTENTKTISNNVDILFLIDNTISMNAEDYQNHEKRLEGVKKDCQKIITELDGARFSIVTFDNKAKILIPFTKDTNLALETIEIIEPIDEFYARGSSLNIPLGEAKRILNNSYQKESERLRILFFISDGEITNDSSLESYSSLSKYIQEGAVLGYGTREGGIMHYKETFTDQEDREEKVVMDKTSYPYKEAISKYDENNLKQIAKDLKIDYIHMEHSNKIDSKIKTIKAKMKEDRSSLSKSGYEDLYYLFAIPLLILIVIEFKKTRRDCA